MQLSLREIASLSVLLFTVMLMPACSRQAADDLAVSKMPISEMQATKFLPLNADKPGTPVAVEQYLVPGKYTIVEYFSPYDGVSADLEPRLIQLTQFKPDIAVRTVNINRPEAQDIDWQSPVLQDLPVQKLPYFRIYDPRRALRAHGRPAYEQISQWVQ